MHVVRTTGAGGPEVLSLDERPEPDPWPLGAARPRASHRAQPGGPAPDHGASTPAPPDAPPDVPGLEYAGEVLGRWARARGASRSATG